RAGLHPALHRLPAGGSGGGRHSPVGARRVTAAPPRPLEGDPALQKALRRAEKRSVIGHKPSPAVHPWRMTAAPPRPPAGDSALQKSLRRAEERSVIGRGWRAALQWRGWSLSSSLARPATRTSSASKRPR